MQPRPISHPYLHTERTPHGFFTREGGLSDGIHAGLNCGYGSRDAGDVVRRNRARVADTLGVGTENLITMYQIHSADVHLAEQPWRPDGAPRGDAMVTTTPGLALGILTADCAPVLFADSENGVVGAAHAGWKGALSGVLEATVQTMADQGARRERISAVLGPCIAQDSYEVGPEFEARFVAQNRGYAAFFAPAERPGHYQFDLAGFVMSRLAGLGLGQCHDLALDTYADDQRFYSYRRSCHRDEPDYGRQIAAITQSTD
ncbi:MAG: peptidoglycan editing factor PgeF [Alphaproteobacteria bacterium]|nr:peptidoglycan editing factor PgeF [Alphaproteobacteria bacterium]